MIGRYIELYGLPCGLCGLPAHHSEVFPNGVRTVHMDWRKRPCDAVHPAAKRPDRRGSEPANVLPHAPASVRCPSLPQRRSA
jgi:hypothetical protein